MANVAVEGTEKPVLLEGPEAARAPQSPMIVQVARAYGVSPLRQLRETFALRFGQHKLRPKDYYDFGLYDPAIPMTEKRQFVGVTGNEALNKRLSPPELIPTGAFVGNKVLYGALLEKMGLPATRTQAVVSVNASFGTLPVLRNAVEMQSFLTKEASFPLFGKPLHGSLSEGSVRIDAVARGEVHIGNGTRHDIAVFCAEVMSKFPGGFLLQTALAPHPDMARVTGAAMGCVRMVTVNDTGTPRPAYALWKIPSPDAMSDNFWQSGSMLGMLDLETGRVLACRRGTGLKTEDIENHPVSGARIVDMVLPHWDAALDLAAKAHGLFPEFGVCGFDIAICPDGPHVIECNDNPFHTLYQLATGRGIANTELQPIWDGVAKRQKERLDVYLAAERKSRRARG